VPKAAPDTGKRAVVVGGGFAGVACAKELGKHGVDVTLVDRNNYHQFQPLLYQLATGMLGTSDIARPLRGIFRKQPNVEVKRADVSEIDTATKTVHTADGLTFAGDYLVLAMGAQPNFFHTPGADKYTFPLYSIDDSKRLRTRIFEVFEEADVDQSLIARGALDFVVVGGGATGVETAGALADLLNNVMPKRFHTLDVHAAKITLVDVGHTLLAPFSEHAHDYAAKVLQRRGVELRLGVAAKEIHKDRVVLGDGTEILTRTVVWAGGLIAPAIVRDAGLPTGRGGRVDVEPDLSVPGHAGVYAIGDIANIPGADGEALPQLGSVAVQAGTAAAASILASIDGKPAKPFNYHDKGIMAMVGNHAAIAEVGKHHHELHGPVAAAAWLGVHAWLMSGVRQRVEALVSWGWDNYSASRAASLIDGGDQARIDWGDEDDEDDEDDAATDPSA
jgi:NADH dehydrogenase